MLNGGAAYAALLFVHRCHVYCRTWKLVTAAACRSLAAAYLIHDLNSANEEGEGRQLDHDFAGQADTNQIVTSAQERGTYSEKFM